MSAFVVTRRTMDVVVTALQDSKHAAGQRVFAGEAINHDSNCLDRIGRKLWDLNVRAVNGRYPDLDQTSEGTELAKIYLWNGTYWPSATRRQVSCRYLKALRCLRYQCSEDATMNDPIMAELSEAINDLAIAIVSDLPDYAAAPWDFEEKDIPKAVRLI